MKTPRLILVVALLAASGCGERSSTPAPGAPAAPGASLPAGSGVSGPGHAALAGDWLVDPEAVRRTMLAEARADWAAEGHQGELPADRLAAVEESARSCTLTLQLGADGAFLLELRRKEPGLDISEASRGTWSVARARVTLSKTTIDGEPVDPPEEQQLDVHEGRLKVPFLDHMLPLKRR